jgi:hypothetical protein
LTTANSGISVTVKFTPTDSTTYETVFGTITVTIGKATPTGAPGYTAITAAGKTLDDAALTIGAITPGGTITWDLATTTPVASGTAYGWMFTPTDTTNYTTLTGNITPYNSSGSGGGPIVPVTTDPAIDTTPGAIGELETTEPPVTPDSIPAVSVPTAPGGTADLPKTIDFGDGHKSDATWTSSDEKIARIDANGDLVGVGEGTVTLTATSAADPSKKITIKVTIAKNVTAIRSPVKTLYVKKGRAITPSVDFDGKDAKGKAWGYKGYGAAPKLTWTSSNTNVATVNSKTGKITPKQNGTAKITAKALNGKSCTFTVKVVSKAKKLTKLTLKKPPTSLKVGKTAVLKLKLTSAKATNLKVTFKSSKPSVIKVDNAGKLYAVKKGTAKITVKAGGKKKVITVRVK